MTKLFVWDFHGVLEKDHEHSVVEVTNQVLEEFGFEPKLDVKLCLELYGRKWFEYFQILAPEADEKKIKDMVSRGVEITNSSDAAFKHIKPMDFSHEVLNKIKQAGHENLIISNTEPNALKKYLDSVKITGMIAHRIGADSHRTDINSKNSKIPLMKEFLKSREYDGIIAIGDMDADIELGKSIGAVTYLFSKKGNFPDCDPHYKITDLREVLKEV